MVEIFGGISGEIFACFLRLISPAAARFWCDCDICLVFMVEIFGGIFGEIFACFYG